MGRTRALPAQPLLSRRGHRHRSLHPRFPEDAVRRSEVGSDNVTRVLPRLGRSHLQDRSCACARGGRYSPLSAPARGRAPNVGVTIPNGTVLSSQVINYTTLAVDGLILHTSITIGYDSPWRQVHELMIEAARRTENIEAEPGPFVLQTSLDDFYVSYELNAYTYQPALMALTYSRLHENIQETFNEAGVEIMSPHYRAQRDGNQITIPVAHLTGEVIPPRRTQKGR